MAKMRIHEFAKELGVSSKDIISCLDKFGEKGKSAQSSIEEDLQSKVRTEFTGGTKAAGTEEMSASKEKVDSSKNDLKPQENKQVVTAEAEKSAENPVKKKKSNLIFVSNPHNSQHGGKTGGNYTNKNQMATGNAQNRQPGMANKSQGGFKAQGPQKLIKPNVPRTANVMMNHVEEKPVNQPIIKPVVKPAVPPVAETTGVNNDGGQNNQTSKVNVKENVQKNQNVAKNPSSDSRSNGNISRDNGRNGERREKNSERVNSFSGNRERDNYTKNSGDNRGFRNFDRKDNNSKTNVSIAFGTDQKGAGKENRRDDSDKRRQNNDKHKKNQNFLNEDGFHGGKPVKGAKTVKLERPTEKPKEIKEEEKIKVITLPATLTIKDLADKMKVQPAVIIKKLFLQGKVVTVNQEISYEQAEEIAVEFDILCEQEVVVDVIEELLKEEEEDVNKMVKRPPVICVMGHVDHGKTSLLDAIRKTRVIDREAGGITQHIGAYVVNVNGQKITFLDTPGHEAFTAMRMRGANSTDIAILVVAADDGVMPQTIEAINHAKAAGIEIIVAVNKIDKPSANIDRVKQELSEYDLIPEDWGGSTVFAPVSAKSGEGIEELLEMILLTSDILELKANPKRKARGLVIEAQLDKGRGPVATVLVQKGTLKVGDFIAAGACHGKVRAMIDDNGKRVKEAGPSTPVEILGLNDVPNAGEIFVSPDNDKEAKNFAQTFISQNKVKLLDDTKSKMSLDDLFTQIKEGNLKELNLIIKADVQGSVEAVKESLVKLSNDEVIVKVIHGGVGAINESDVILASASNAIIIGFNVRPDATAKNIAETEGVDVRLYNVIYKAIEDVEAAMKGMLDPVFEEKIIGHAEIRQIFKASGVGNIAGSYVLDGVFQRGCSVRITHEGEQIYEGKLASLKRFKDDVKEVKSGFECGLVFEEFNDFAELDVVEAYVMVEVPR